MASSFVGYWADVRQRIADQMEVAPRLESLIIKRRRFNQNNSGLSYCVQNGRLTYRTYTQHKESQTTSPTIDTWRKAS
ncbi:hypothetical protein NMS23_003475 [Vibrio parahaemolyticus]|nr:hypothetical protein [Vibrio parahaemolyticus]